MFRLYHSPVQIHVEKRQVIAPRAKFAVFCVQRIPSKSQNHLRTLPMFFPVNLFYFFHTLFMHMTIFSIFFTHTHNQKKLKSFIIKRKTLFNKQCTSYFFITKFSFKPTIKICN